MFARNGRTGYVLKPEPLRIKMKEEQIRRIQHVLTIKVSVHFSVRPVFLDAVLNIPSHIVLFQVISAQQLPHLPSSSHSRLASFNSPTKLDPYVSLSLHSPILPPLTSSASSSLASAFSRAPPTPILRAKTRSIADNGFNPLWNESKTLSWVGAEGMEDLAFVRFEVRHDPSMENGEEVGKDGEDGEGVAGYCVSVGCLNQG